MENSEKMYRRLYSLAFKRFGCDHDASHDYATDSLCKMFEEGTNSFNFGFTVLVNQIRTDVRDRKRRKTYQFPVDEEGEPMELKVAAYFADADEILIVNECLNSIEAMPPETRAVMRLVALEATPDEIVLDRGIPKSEVYWRTQMGRKLLRDRAGYELERKRGHHKYIGIRKDCRKWVAAIRKGEEYFHIGYFDTASEAAKAYDSKAMELNGPSAKLNFLAEAAE